MIKQKEDNSNKSKILMKLFANDLSNGRAFHNRLFRQAYYSGIKIFDIEDLIQDYYISTSRSIRNFKGDINESTDLIKDNKLGPYLSRGFIYRTMNYIRDKNRINMPLFSEIEKEDYKIDQQGRYKQEAPEEEAIKKEHIEKIMATFQRLDEKDKTIISLRYFSELRYKEIAEHLGIPLGTVTSRLNVTKEKIKKSLNKTLH